MILVAVIGFLGISNSAFAQQRTEIADGVYLVKYGNAAYGIENDNTKQCINLTVTQQKKSDGSAMYNILCGNKLTKDITKGTLAAAITTTLTSLGQPWLSVVALPVANNIYDDVCNYFR